MQLSSPEHLTQTHVEQGIVGRVFAGIEGNPSQVQIGSKIRLNVGFDLDKAYGKDLPVRVSVSAPGFIMNSSRDSVISKKLTISRGQKNIRAALEFQAINYGEHEILINFYAKNDYLGTIELQIKVDN